MDFDDDADAAVAYALQTALSRGAVQGLSSAVAKALQSSSDVNTAVAEALKVQNLETLLGGVTGQIDKVFKDEAAQAAERVDLARKYGLDLLQVEKVNAEQRADLIASTLKSRIGGIQDALDELATGDLSEGSASDKRYALRAKFQAAQTDALAGKDGAADTLAQLATQLISSDKDAFGTAGPEYATDRGDVTAVLEQGKQAETDRVNASAAAQQATTAAVQDTTDAIETVGAGTNARLDQLIALVGSGKAAIAPNLALVTR